MSDGIDGLPSDTLRTVLIDCTGSVEWSDLVLAARPYGGSSAFLAAVEAAWAALGDAAWLAAFAARPVLVPADADEGSRRAAELALELYRRQFGVPFVCSEDSSAANELLMRVRIRLANDDSTERQVARDEQRRAVQRRLQHALASHGVTLHAASDGT
jgi:hypothetical protein